MKLDEFKAGKLPPDDPWVQEMAKRGLLPRKKVFGGAPHQVMGVSPAPPEPGRNLLNPHLPGTKEFTQRVDNWQPPNPLTTKPSENDMLKGALALTAPTDTELWHGIQYPKTYKGFRLEGDPQKWGAVQYSQIDKGANAAPITFYVKPGQDLESRLTETLAKFGKK